MNEELLTLAEVAERLKLNPQTIRNWIDRGELEHVRLGARRIRIPASALVPYVGSSLPDTTAQAASTGDGEPAAPPVVRAPRATAARDLVRDRNRVSSLVQQMLATAATLPENSDIARELASSAGRLQVLLIRTEPPADPPADED